MHWLKHVSERLIFLASSRVWPFAPVFLIFSLPARSTRDTWATSHEKFKARDLDGDYADIARSLGGWSEVIDDPEDIASSLLRAKEKNQEGISVLLQFNTSKDQNFANMRPFG